MASGITHILLMKYLQNVLPAGELKMILAAGRDFLQAGAVGPDLPYASIADNDFFFTTQSDLADKFHYEKTNQVPLRALARLRERIRETPADESNFAFCFFVGYLSHVVADGIIHPFIRDQVGDYKGHQTAHRVLEMKLDVLLFHHLTRQTNAPIELNYSNIHDELMNLDRTFYPDLPRVIALFSDMIQEVYDARYEPDRILGWLSGLHRMFGVAEGNHPAIYRILGFINDILFENYQQLRDQYQNLLVLRTPVDRGANFLKKPSVHYFDEVVPHFYETFIPVAQKAYAYVFEGREPLAESDLPPVDLDTGRLLASNNNLDLIPSFWS